MMKLFKNNLIKKIFSVLAALAVIVLPVATNAATVRIESNVGVANVTAGQTQYSKSVSAKVDEVVKVQVWYHNMENENSGLVANNLRVKIGYTTGQGTSQTISSRVSADNSNTVVDSANVNLSLNNAYLEYIPGSAKWRHNIGTNAAPNWVTQTVSDAVVTDPNGLVLENEQPCFNFEATVTALFRVKAQAVSITKQVRVVGQTQWVTENTANPGDILEYEITFKNEGNTVLNNVAVGDNLPPNMTYINGSTWLKNGNFPNGININSDNITNGGILVGNYNPGAVGYVLFRVQINPNLAPGSYEFRNVGIVRPQGMNEFYNIAITRVTVPGGGNNGGGEQPTPTPGGSIPRTGIETPIAGGLGASGLGYATYAYIRSRKGLKNALRGLTKK